MIEWISIPSGSFLMGGIEDDKFVTGVELPRHRVTFAKGFSMSRHPVTNREWESVMDGSPHLSVGNPLLAPVVGVTWDEANQFCEKLSRRSGAIHRLPTEAEWEYTCRGGTTGIFPQGGDLTPRQANYLYDELGRKVGPGCLTVIGNYEPNPFGVADLLGNVCEWTADHWHPDFHDAPADGSARVGPDAAGRRVIRGGGWDHLPRTLRASWRDWAPLSARWDNLGFRVIKENETS